MHLFAFEVRTGKARGESPKLAHTRARLITGRPRWYRLFSEPRHIFSRQVFFLQR